MEPAACPTVAEFDADARQAERAQTERIYVEINRTWREGHVFIQTSLGPAWADVKHYTPPDKILETPGWQDGWAALAAGLKEKNGWDIGGVDDDFCHSGDWWKNEIHIFSYCADSSGHSLSHARFEHELTLRVIEALGFLSPVSPQPQGECSSYRNPKYPH